MNRSAIDRLGVRLREGDPSESDLIALDAYRHSARMDYDEVLRRISEHGIVATGRPAKSTRSIVDKLRRESSRLTQIQDIAGCRVVVGEIELQDKLVATLLDLLPGSKLIDRRQAPSFGYRAVHLVYKGSGAPIEVQVRTALQHAWAEYSEKLSDRLGAEIKYGKGDEQVRTVLDRVSTLIAAIENAETQNSAMLAQRRAIAQTMQEVGHANLDEVVEKQIREIDAEMTSLLSTTERHKASLLAALMESSATLIRKSEA